MGQYAKGTEVSQDKTLAEIRAVLKRFGATGFSYAEHSGPPARGLVEFEMQNRRVRFIVELPAREKFLRNSYGNVRPATAIDKDHDQAGKQKWRALALVIKAKLVAVEDDIVSFEQEFAMHFVLPNNTTVFETLAPRLAELCESGNLPSMLPALPRHVE